MADDGHTINVGPVTIGEPLARPPVADLDLADITARPELVIGGGPTGIIAIDPDERDVLVTVARWAQDAPHHGDCPARHLAGGGTDNFADYVLVAYPCTCGRDEAFARLKADR